MVAEERGKGPRDGQRERKRDGNGQGGKERKKEKDGQRGGGHLLLSLSHTLRILNEVSVQERPGHAKAHVYHHRFLSLPPYTFFPHFLCHPIYCKYFPFVGL